MTHLIKILPSFRPYFYRRHNTSSYMDGDVIIWKPTAFFSFLVPDRLYFISNIVKKEYYRFLLNICYGRNQIYLKNDYNTVTSNFTLVLVKTFWRGLRTWLIMILQTYSYWGQHVLSVWLTVRSRSNINILDIGS